MERRQEVVEIECFSSEDTLPLGGRDTGGCIPVELCEEFGARDVFVVDLEAFTGLSAAVILGERGGVVRVVPHVALFGSPLLSRRLVEVVDVILGVILRSDLVSDLVEDLIDGLVHRLILFWMVHEESGVSSGVDRVEFFDIKVKAFSFSGSERVALSSMSTLILEITRDLDSFWSRYLETKDESLSRNA